MNIEKIKRISLNKIVVNKIYLYSAGFNVDRKLNNKSRINEELKDLKILLKGRFLYRYRPKLSDHFQSKIVTISEEKLNVSLAFPVYQILHVFNSAFHILFSELNSS